MKKTNELTNEQKLYARKIGKPNFIYNVLGAVWRAFMYKKYNVHYTFKTKFDKKKGPYIFISNHASRLDYIFTGIPMLPARLNYVAGYNEFYRSHLAGVFKLLKVIPKKNFTPDHYALKEINRILKKEGRIIIFPEGMNSISGANQPVAIGTGKFIKHFKVPVYYSVIKGGYLTSPKYDLTDRCGRIDVEIDRLFTPQQLETLTAEEIEDTVNKALYHDDYAWNKEKKYRYNIGKTGAEGLETLLFWCPKCGKQHTTLGKGNVFSCQECGNGFTLQDTYEMTPLDETCVLPATQTEWFNMQREAIKKEVQKEDFVLTENVRLGTLPKQGMLKNQATSNIVGEGVLTLDRSGLTYTGTRDGGAFTFHIDSKNLPTYGMCTDISRFYTFYNGEFMEFYPENNVVEKFFLATEEIHRLNGGKWQDFKFEK
ncbi:MAG: 1-acyl-sn-glycerol-3-phosphate acyltransferase [Clostridia bacterium]|nr:1-acyl-sn-glycerol-3-phosphate acyltransferase [Clostridia bacterium]